MSSQRKQKGDDYKKEDVLQAVVIADNFDTRFAPLTCTKPRILLPLANIPLLEYTLEFLVSSGIQEIIIFCCNHANQIKAYLEGSSWLAPSSPVDIITVVSEDCLSVGDALRDIDAKSLISSDFVLINGGSVANVNLKPILEKHKALRLKDKSVMMTLLFKKAPPGHVIRRQQDDIVMAVRPEDNRIISYQNLENKKKFHLSLEIFTSNECVQLRYDLMNTGISVCSPHVTALFTDNFDYQTRGDFVRGILIDEEVMDNKLYLHVLNEAYAAHVSNLHMYDAVSNDILTRWVYPIVPDGAIANNNLNRCSHGRHNIYLNKNVTLARGCTLKQNVLIGEGTTIGDNTFITDSVIGNNCVIGKDIKLTRAYIWDGVRIDDGCQLEMCIIDSDVHLMNDVVVQRGCVIASKVKVGSGKTLHSGLKLTAVAPSDEQLNSDAVNVVGEDGHGYVYSQPTEFEDEDIDELTEEMWGMEVNSEDAETESMTSVSEDDEDTASHPMLDDINMFLEEVFSTLQRALSEDTDSENLVLEVNSVKHAYDIQIKEVNHLLTKAIITLPLKSEPSMALPEYLKQVTQNLHSFKSLLSNYIRSEESQMDCLLSIEECCLANPTIQKGIIKLIHYLYEDDILSEDVIINWHGSQLAEDEHSKQSLRKQVVPFIRWLQEAEEESEDESD